MTDQTPGLFRVQCSANGCGAVVCGVGVAHKAIRAVGWLVAYGAPLCPTCRPDGLVAASSEAAKYQAAVGMARFAERIASAVISDPIPQLTGGGPGEVSPWDRLEPAPAEAPRVLTVAPEPAPPPRARPPGPRPPGPWGDK